MTPRIKSSLFVALSASLILLFGVAGARPSTAASASPAADRAEMSKQAAFQSAMRKLWEDHITWTRVFIISAAADLPDKDAATQRLLQNQMDIGNAVKPYYGAG